jgi:hypothetical protein
VAEENEIARACCTCAENGKYIQVLVINYRGKHHLGNKGIDGIKVKVSLCFLTKHHAMKV